MGRQLELYEHEWAYYPRRVVLVVKDARGREVQMPVTLNLTFNCTDRLKPYFGQKGEYAQDFMKKAMDFVLGVLFSAEGSGNSSMEDVLMSFATFADVAVNGANTFFGDVAGVTFYRLVTEVEECPQARQLIAMARLVQAGFRPDCVN